MAGGGLTLPLRDHFRPPLERRRHWGGFYAQWAAMMVLALSPKLPRRYGAEPRVQRPTLTLATELPAATAHEVRVFDRERGSCLVAVVELVSPANKDRPEHRRAFVAKCAALLQEQVSVAIVDVVTARPFNLYGELLELIGETDPALTPEAPALYAAACRGTKKDNAWLLETWTYPVAVGQPLPTLPLWLADNLAVPLELEASYEETCRILRIP
jgi:predicted cobalt transporter CbtA